MDVVTSLQHPIVKLVRALESKKRRRETGLFVAEGAEVLDRARREGWTPAYVVSEGAAAAWSDARRIRVSKAVMEIVSGQNNPAGIIGIFRQRLSDVTPAPGSDDLWIGLEAMRDPGNLGTIIRTADAVSANGVILIGQCCDAYSSGAIRATTGSIFAVPLSRMKTTDFLQLIAGWPGETVATAMVASDDYRRTYSSPVLLLVGSEGAGLSPALLEACRTRVRIPMPGGTESLNAAVAAALVLYEIRRPALS